MASNITVGSKVTYIKKSEKAQDWTGTVLFVDEAKGIVTVDWVGARSKRQVFQTNPIEEVAPMEAAAKETPAKK